MTPANDSPDLARREAPTAGEEFRRAFEAEVVRAFEAELRRGLRAPAARYRGVPGWKEAMWEVIRREIG
jgi:hypothetical protein